MSDNACYRQPSYNSVEIRAKLLSVQAINFRDEKLYQITSRDYGDPFSRAFTADEVASLRTHGIVCSSSAS
jgi:hypothetical protein